MKKAALFLYLSALQSTHGFACSDPAKHRQHLEEAFRQAAASQNGGQVRATPSQPSPVTSALDSESSFFAPSAPRTPSESDRETRGRTR
jgi:hypothetical protein